MSDRSYDERPLLAASLDCGFGHVILDKKILNAPTVATITGTAAAPWNLIAGGKTLLISIDGGGDQTVTFDAAAAVRECVNTSTYNLTNGWTITCKIDDGTEQTVTFLTADFNDITVATAIEVALKMDTVLTGCSVAASSGDTKVSVTGDTEGTGSSVEVTGGTANTALGFVTDKIDGTGDVADITAVSKSEATTLIEADTSDLTATTPGNYLVLATTDTGASASIQVKDASTAELIFGLDTLVHTGPTGAESWKKGAILEAHGATADTMIKWGGTNAPTGILIENLDVTAVAQLASVALKGLINSKWIYVDGDDTLLPTQAQIKLLTAAGLLVTGGQHS